MTWLAEAAEARRFEGDAGIGVGVGLAFTVMTTVSLSDNAESLADSFSV